MDQPPKSAAGKKRSTGNLGTFAGVFTPSILTILGIILFLRLGYVVGSAGLGRTLIILVFANGISILTTISLSAIATNIHVKGGGDYYLISRTLGLEFGGAIGIVLFLAQSVSIGFYCIGFGEAVVRILPGAGQIYHSPQVIAVAAALFLFLLAWLGADWATRFQYVVMAILVAALISYFAGGVLKWETVQLAENWRAPENGPGFWILFAIFFPAVTGFTQGVSMSGDLKDPGKSLPLGTFAAVGISIVIYFFAAVIFSAAAPRDTLMNNYGAMQQVAFFGPLITAGVIAATMSSAMASFLGAPRILQSLSGDRIFRFLLPFAKGVGPNANPRRGVLLSGGIAAATIALGNLNLIAPVVSMFFLVSYGLLNYATFFETRTGSTAFRPRFHWYDGRLSLLGALACFGVMLAIDMAAGLAALAVLFSIYQYLKRTAGPSRWADGKRSYHLQRVREHLLAAAAEPDHPRDWRPQMLLLGDDPKQRKPLMQLAGWVAGNSGVISVVQIVTGKGAKALKHQLEARQELEKEVADYGPELFPLVVRSEDFGQGMDMLVQAAGLGPLKTNLILTGWPSPEKLKGPLIHKTIYDKHLRTVFRRGRNIMILDAKPEAWEKMGSTPEKDRRVDVWWWNDATGRLMLLLAHLMTRHKDWDEARIRILSAGHKDLVHPEYGRLSTFLEDVRIEAEAVEIVNSDAETIAAWSKDAALVFMPFQLQQNCSVDPFGGPIEELLPRLPSTVLVLAAEDIALDAEPEEGKAGELARATDKLSDTQKKAQKAEKAAEKASRELDDKLKDLAKAQSADNAAKEDQAKKEVFEAEAEAEKASRKAAKAEAKIRLAAEEAEKAGANLPEKAGDDQTESTSDNEKHKLP
ncbi:MAG: amino acid permease [Thermodesulfobacteriota bacterium]